MTIEGGVRLSCEQAYSLLLDFDSAFDPALHRELDLSSYSQKLASNAYFVLAKEDIETVGFIAYYLNDEGKFCYVPLLAVSNNFRNCGIAKGMFTELYSSIPESTKHILLEVEKNNIAARSLYRSEGFFVAENRENKLLLMRA